MILKCKLVEFPIIAHQTRNNRDMVKGRNGCILLGKESSHAIVCVATLYLNDYLPSCTSANFESMKIIRQIELAPPETNRKTNV